MSIGYPDRIADPNIKNKFREVINEVNVQTDQLQGLTASPGAHTITLAKLTPSGTEGSITWNAAGIVTAFKDPT